MTLAIAKKDDGKASQVHQSLISLKNLEESSINLQNLQENFGCFGKILRKNLGRYPGAGLGFSRGGGGAGFEQFCRPFFRSTKLIFERSQRPYFDQVFCAAINFLKKQAKKGVLGNFWKILTKTLRFFSARSPSKLVYIGAEGAFRKFLGFVTKNGYFKTVQTRTLWVGKGSNP